jgi:hypothetical protein
VCMGFRREPGALIGADDLQGSGGDQGAAQGRHGGARSVRGAGGPARRYLEWPEAVTCRAGACLTSTGLLRLAAVALVGARQCAPRRSAGPILPPRPRLTWSHTQFHQTGVCMSGPRSGDGDSDADRVRDQRRSRPGLPAHIGAGLAAGAPDPAGYRSVVPVETAAHVELDRASASRARSADEGKVPSHGPLIVVHPFG